MLSEFRSSFKFTPSWYSVPKGSLPLSPVSYRQFSSRKMRFPDNSVANVRVATNSCVFCGVTLDS